MSKQFEKIVIVTDAASSDITGKSCSPYTVHWTYDTYANAHAVGTAMPGDQAFRPMKGGGCPLIQ